MPISLQAKLLRVIQEKKVMPIGSSEERDVNVRIVATTNRNMVNEIQQGRFREDLYYRLNVFQLTPKSYLIAKKIYQSLLQICCTIWIQTQSPKR